MQRRRPTTSGPLGGSRPDRVAAWAFLLGVFLILLAATTSHGATTTGGAGIPGQQPAHVSGPDPLAEQLG